ncbi:MAG: hypothetical protein Ct9H300mP11_12210 [Chloroflexota bacterium]|nr:MAG: hypothetical protein Ct9H300mP11_12210 [Chloroflexota bacterium]
MANSQYSGFTKVLSRAILRCGTVIKNRPNASDSCPFPKGKVQDNVAEVTAGDIGAIGKLNATITGDSLTTRDAGLKFPQIKQPVGYFRMAVSPASKDDLDKMSMALSRIVEEDPTLQFSRDPSTSESLKTRPRRCADRSCPRENKTQVRRRSACQNAQSSLQRDHNSDREQRISSQETVRGTWAIRPCAPAIGAPRSRPRL